MARVLVVDDEKGLRITMREFLGSEGHEVQVAATGQEALALLEEQDVDVVVLDIILPEVGGLTLLSTLRKMNPDVSVIMITGEPTFETAAEAVRSGAFDYLPKPISREKLVDTVAKASRVASLEKENRAHRERLEQLVAERTAELHESERRYRLLAENATDTIFTMDLSLRPTYTSPSITRLRGFTVEEARALTPEQNMTPESLELARKVLTEELARETEAGADPRRSRTLELELYRADGSTCWHEVTLTFVRDEQGRAVAIEEVARDISKRRQAERERRALEEQLRQSQKMEAMGRLAGGVAHDFNNLLSAILGYASLVKTQVGRSDPIRADLEEIDKAGRRAAGLTQQLLAFSRKEIIEPELLSVNDVVSDMDRMLRRVIGEDVELGTDLDPEVPAVRMDRGHLGQVLVNLAVNARDAMPGGGVLAVSTSCIEARDIPAYVDPVRAAERYVRLALQDSGCGMSPEVLERVFEPFFTTKEDGKGTGLGLSTVYGIVKQAGGEIRALSETGQGSRFEVYLPAAEQPEGARVRSRPVPSTGPAGGTVLVVEDEEAVRVLAGRILETNGYTVLLAGSGPEGLRLAAEHGGAIDLLLTDVIMPGMSGKELAGRLRQERPRTRVLYMSGYTDDVIAEQGVLQDGVQLVQKPFRAEELVEAVARVLQSR